MADTISAYRRGMILKWHEQGYSVTDTARLLKIPEQAVIGIIDQACKPTERKPSAGEDVPLW